MHRKQDYFAVFTLHISHILQPLNLSIFASMKALYQKTALKIIKEGDLSRISKAQFIQIYFKIRGAVMSQSNVESGWRKSGIYSLNSE